MTFPNRPVEAIEGWHAHIYYDPDATKDTAAGLRARIEDAFPMRVSGTSSSIWARSLAAVSLVEDGS